MNNPSAETYVLPTWLRSWEQFWFTPRDPSVLALIRIACGLLTVYTFFVYSFSLPDSMGEYAWLDLPYRLIIVRERPAKITPLSGHETPSLPPPADEFQKRYLEAYQKLWGIKPPPPYPTTLEQANYLHAFRVTYHQDLRAFGLPIPTKESELEYVAKYMKGWANWPANLHLPPPAYPKNARESEEIDEYRRRHGVDPRLVYTRGIPAFSIWFHVTDPDVMAVIQWLFVLSSVLFTIGFCTRVTAALTWFASLSYVHRSSTMMFGADTMMNILLLYLMIGPSGAAYSVDQLIRRWWSKAKPGVIRWWFALWKQPLGPQDVAVADFAPSAPSICANFVIRLLQVHLCIIYLVAGLAKLLGQSWWNGTAVWSTIANYEFAPMDNELYLGFLRFLSSHLILWSVVVTGGTLFTLVFEITYAFLIWRPHFRWLFLASAMLLHGFIGVLMGLKTFALIMVVMNLVFLRTEEAVWILRWFGRFAKEGETVEPATPPPQEQKTEPVKMTAAIKQ